MMVGQSDDHEELTSETCDQDDASLLHSAPSHAELQGPSTPCQEVQLDSAGAAAASVASSELMFDQGTCTFGDQVCPCGYSCQMLKFIVCMKLLLCMQVCHK